jgi:hypothetical protein
MSYNNDGMPDTTGFFRDAEQQEWKRLLAAKDREITALREALAAMLQAVCGDSGFANAVRSISGIDYPWPALDLAEEKARAALSTPPAPDPAEVSPAVQKSMDYFHRRCAEVDAEAIRAKALDIDAALDAWFDADPDWREWPLADQYRHDMSLAVIAALNGNGEGPMTKEHERQLLIDQRDVLYTDLERLNAAISRLDQDEPSEVKIRRQRDEEWR